MEPSGNRRNRRHAVPRVLHVGIFVATVTCVSSSRVQQAAGSSPDANAPAGDPSSWLHFLPQQAPVNTPLPMYVTADHLTNARRARLHFQAFGSPRFLEVEMAPRHDLHSLPLPSPEPAEPRGFAATIPAAMGMLFDPLLDLADVVSANLAREAEAPARRLRGRRLPHRRRRVRVAKLWPAE